MELDDTLDLSYLIKILKKHLIFIIVVGIMCGIAAFCISNFAMTKKYESRALLYVENNQQAGDSVNINDITAAQKLVNTCQILFKSNTILDELKNNLNLPYSNTELNDMIKAQSVNSTEVMELVVECDNPEEAEKIVNELVRLSNLEFKRVIKSGSIEVVNYGEISNKPSSPDVTKITAIGLLLGLIAAYGVFFVIDMLNTAVKPGDDIAKIYNVPVFAEITEFTLASNAKYGKYSKYNYYSYDNRKKSKKSYNKKTRNSDIARNNGNRLINADTPFSITEAYNTARTNIMFAASTGERKIIAVTSSNASEGKSTTCSNIAISFANAGNKVLLVECDLRKPTMAKNFKIDVEKGLSEILGGFCGVSDALVSDAVPQLDIITAGNIPPNPCELLSSNTMKMFLKASAESYDYVFLDTPPVNVVTDSQLMNDVIAGFVLAVKENSTTHPDVKDMLDKVSLANGKALGFVKTFCHPEKTGHYGKKYYSYYKYGYSEKNPSKADAK